MCTDDTPARHVHPAPLLHDFEPSVTFDLEPVDSVTVTTLMDNVTDMFMPDQGPAHRPPPGTGGCRPAAVIEGGLAPSALLAEHGFSVLVTVAKNDSRHQILFDIGTSPDGAIGNMDRLEIDPAGFEVIVCSHGHFDHTTGLDGLIRRMGRANLPILIHHRRAAREAGERTTTGAPLQTGSMRTFPAFLLMARTLASARVSECHLIGAIALRHRLPSNSRHGSFGKSKSYPERTRSADTRSRSGVAR